MAPIFLSEQKFSLTIFKQKQASNLGSLGSEEILTKLNKMQLLTKFQNNLMDRSQIIQLNPT